MKPIANFSGLEQLIMDYNHMKNLDSLPALSQLKVLSISYNMLSNEMATLQQLTKKCPNIEHLNLMKNPCNPVFTNASNYSVFRARFAIWLPQLKTLDGTDFTEDQTMIREMKPLEEKKRNEFLGRSGGLGSVPEDKKGMVDRTLKAQAGTTAFEFNQKAHKKYNSSKSLLERILKSHSEGNRFIKNDDL